MFIQFQKFLFSEKKNPNCEKLNTRFHAKIILAAILKKKTHITSLHVLRHTLLHPPCNTDQVITPLDPVVQLVVSTNAVVKFYRYVKSVVQHFVIFNAPLNLR